jgi:hypothetical protein
LTASLPQYNEDFALALAPFYFEWARVAFQLLQSNFMPGAISRQRTARSLSGAWRSTIAQAAPIPRFSSRLQRL